MVAGDPNTDAITDIRSEETHSDEALSIEPSQAMIVAAGTDQLHGFEGRSIACAEDPWSSIDGKCNRGKVHKHLSAGLAGKTKVSVIGLKHAAAASPLVAVNPDSGTPNSAAPTAPTSRPANHPKLSEKAQRPSRSKNGGRDWARELNWHDDPWSARAYAPQGFRYGQAWGRAW
jgi:hypothetical protein